MKPQMINLTAILDTVFPEYKKASEIDLTIENDCNLYKAIDHLGNVYLIKNPSSREFRDGVVIGCKPRWMANVFEKKEVRVQVRKTDSRTRTEMHLAGSIIDMSKF